jgi:excisionase family DNA binding protein
MLRLTEVAERLNCSLSNVYNLIESGKLPIVPTGARGKGYRVTETDLQAFIEQGRHARRPQAWPEKTNPIKLKHVR